MGTVPNPLPAVPCCVETLDLRHPGRLPATPAGRAFLPLLDESDTGEGRPACPGWRHAAVLHACVLWQHCPDLLVPTCTAAPHPPISFPRVLPAPAVCSTPSHAHALALSALGAQRSRSCSARATCCWTAPGWRWAPPTCSSPRCSSERPDRPQHCKLRCTGCALGEELMSPWRSAFRPAGGTLEHPSAVRSLSFMSEGRRRATFCHFPTASGPKTVRGASTAAD